MSTRDNILEAYERRIEENADYYEDDSVAKAKAYVSSIDAYVAIVPESAQSGGRDNESVRFNLPALLAARKIAASFVQTRSAVRRVSIASPCHYRG